MQLICLSSLLQAPLFVGHGQLVKDVIILELPRLLHGAKTPSSLPAFYWPELNVRAFAPAVGQDKSNANIWTRGEYWLPHPVGCYLLLHALHVGSNFTLSAAMNTTRFYLTDHADCRQESPYLQSRPGTDNDNA